VFDDPQAGFEALGERLGHFDKETLVAVLSSREDISEADANRTIAKIEDTRNTAIERAQQLWITFALVLVGLGGFVLTLW
jgi:hypothetical protein